jgi:hypothetical protein
MPELHPRASTLSAPVVTTRSGRQTIPSTKARTRAIELDEIEVQIYQELSQTKKRNDTKQTPLMRKQSKLSLRQ